MTVLHAGGKFDSETYKVSGGLHGVGVSVVNALSEILELEIRRDGEVWEQSYEEGKPKTKLKVTGKTRKTGTKVKFHPDPSIFEKTVFSYDTLATRLREHAFLNKGLKITLTDERTEKSAEFRFTGGIAEFVKHLNRGKTTLHDSPIYMEGKRGTRGDRNCAAVQRHYTAKSFCVREHDQHRGWRHASFRIPVGADAHDQQLRFLDGNVEGAEGRSQHHRRRCARRAGRRGPVRLPQPQFEGQTKGKLNSDIKGPVEQLVNERLGE